VDIAAGTTVTIAPGAVITVVGTATITVHGTLTSSAKAMHAKITGTGWGGIVVASGGTMTLVGTDLDGAGIDVQGGDKAASYDYGTMTNGSFKVETNGTFNTDHAAVVGGGASLISGALTATYLDYAGASMSLGDATATMSVADSKLTGTGGDFFTSGVGSSMKIEYSVITGSHCPFHFDGLTSYTFDHVATRNNGYGLMLYNPDPGPNTITNSSFEDPSFNQTSKGTTINIDGSYIKTKTTVGVVKITNAKNAPVTAAAPRATPGPNG
jgi:hypothetical protein